MGRLLNGFEIDDASGVSVWMQVRKRLAFLIESGWYKPGDRLPTVRELAADIGINYNTVSKVYQDLTRDGYLINNRGKNVTVADVGSDKRLSVDADLSILADAFVEKAFGVGMQSEEILDFLQKRMDDSKRRVG